MIIIEAIVKDWNEDLKLAASFSLLRPLSSRSEIELHES